MIRGLIFDCFGVLYGGSLDALIAMAPSAKEQEIRDATVAKDYGYITYAEHLNIVADAVGKTATEVDEIIRRRQLPNDELMAYMRRARAEYKIGFLSNISDHMIDPLFDGDASKFFDAIILSYKEGIIKPDPAIFSLAAERLGMLPEECIMIDDLEVNCDGARRAGMNAVCHVSNSATIRSIDEIVNEL